MNVAYLTHILKTDSLVEIYGNIDLPPLDANLAVWDAVARGEIELDEENDKIKLLKPAVASSDPDLRNKILGTIQHYSDNKININRGRLNPQIKDQLTGIGYGWHEYIMAIQHLIDDGIIVEQVVEVPEATQTIVKKSGKKKEKVLRPAHKFAFLVLTENTDVSEEWNAREINKWIASFEQAMLK